MAKGKPADCYQQFRQALEREDIRARYWLDFLTFGILAQRPELDEAAALELACAIVASRASAAPRVPMSAAAD